MPFSTAKFLKFRSGMQKRIGSLRSKTEESLECAVETMMEERVDGFFQVEHGLEEVIKSLIEIEEELEVVRDLSGAMRLESRLEFVEDRWDEFDSEIRERPRRRRKRVSLADMLKAASGSGSGSLSESPSTVNNAMDAYAIMGVEFGSSLADVTAAFRTKAKQLHPDSNNGDRSSEPELRRMLEAYQFLKEYLSLSNTEPMRPPDRPYSPSE
ncbi:MAG: J domain-containing protein [Nitrospira sp.]|nr:J domain-containing protein [Nitrospira sp.]MDH4368889.1 J domain-containing protein [Nitrospira sp.]MDH5498769.1 J domain-containing protein [Nitrospira sp.]